MQAAIITLLIIGILIFLSTFLMKSQSGKIADSENEFKKLTFTKEEKQSLLENASIEFVEIAQDKIEDAKDALEKISNDAKIVLWDERLTTVSADRIFHVTGTKGKDRKKG